MKHELRVMQIQGSGVIVNITSMFGDKVFPNLALYVASKQAVIGLTRTAALEAAPVGVRVNAVGPGYIETAMFARVTGSPDNQAAATDTVPQGRAGRPEEVADAIMYLAVSRRWRQGKLTGPPHPARRLSRQLQDDRRRHRARARGSQHPAATQSTRDIDDAGLP
jgi:NAD(P)-dependent dehydrogenase (short-subunit alcohol dehydrogenase family)